MPHFHVSSSHNRASIGAHGLDWDRMGAAPGIAGSPVPEQEGCFLVESPEGFRYVPRRIPASQVRLVREDVPAQEPWAGTS